MLKIKCSFKDELPFITQGRIHPSNPFLHEGERIEVWNPSVKCWISFALSKGQVEIMKENIGKIKEK